MISPVALAAAAVARLDAFAIYKVGIPSLVLMEQAGQVCFRAAQKMLQRVPLKSVSVFCGGGLNGGDGLVVARYLLQSGIKTRIFLLASPDLLKNDTLYQFRILKNLGYDVKIVSSPVAPVRQDIRRSGMLIDAIFGIGLNRPVLEPHSSIMEAMNVSHKPVLAVDIPSGLDATTGKVWGMAVRASRTVTFSCLKKGFLTKEGRALCGRVAVVDIGIPIQAFQAEGLRC